MIPGTIVEDADGVRWFLGDLGWYRLPLSANSTLATFSPRMREPITIVRVGWGP